MKLFTLLGLILGCAGCAALYLSSANQRWLDTHWRAVPARVAALLLLAASGASLMREMQFITTMFVLCTLIMLLLAVFPYLGALRELTRKK